MFDVEDDERVGDDPADHVRVALTCRNALNVILSTAFAWSARTVGERHPASPWKMPSGIVCARWRTRCGRTLDHSIGWATSQTTSFGAAFEKSAKYTSRGDAVTGSPSL
jgi:hypothetical protein